MIIKKIIARKIKSSIGKDTISIIIETKDGKFQASAPQGTSRGKHEVKEFSIRGIDFSIDFVNAFGKRLKKIEIDLIDDLYQFEQEIKKIDPSPDLHIIGGNTLYAFEAALLKAAAANSNAKLWQFILGKRKKIMPRPLGNIIGGGSHFTQEKKTDFQEFLILPKTKHFFDSYFINLQAYKEAKKLLIEKDKIWERKRILTSENALASTLSNKQVFDILIKLKQNIKEKFDIEIELGVDMASTFLWNGKLYIYKNFPKRNILRKEEQINYVLNLIKEYNLGYVEDPFYEEDFKFFSELNKKVHNCLICGDDLTTTNPERIRKAIREKAISAIIIKPNQIGSLLKMRKVIELAKKAKIIPIISHRSGETSDDTIADLAVGFQIPIIKTGILGKERFAKLNRLLKIERLEF